MINKEGGHATIKTEYVLLWYDKQCRGWTKTFYGVSDKNFCPSVFFSAPDADTSVKTVVHLQ